ncbi:preprotein translocase subunit Sec61beta [Candidatus Woesearchaeota archaeon]|nr:preprotein translocase subunit Sec61beta [Candidatus Woesearchaeota archaeon]
MADDRIRMPSSGGGLVRYFEDYKSKIELSPMLVVILIIAVIIIEVLLHFSGSSLFGL